MSYQPPYPITLTILNLAVTGGFCQSILQTISQQHAIDPSAYERAIYVQVLDSYSSPTGSVEVAPLALAL